MSIIVYLGPSLPLDRARAVLDAHYRPPAAQTDLLSDLVNLQPDAIALIDGVFMRTNAVWHKEILFALERGIPVYGASSMGALRAAECDAFGMIGVGAVYRMYASGDLIDDDEVALAHGPPDSGYLKTSEPMVNIRATFAAARERGIVSPDEHDEICTIAKRLHFSDRVFPLILSKARERGLAPETIERLGRFVRTDYVDLKAQDALELLERLAHPEAHPAPEVPELEVRRTSGFLTMYNCDRRVVVDEVPVRLNDIVRHSAVNLPDYNLLVFNAMNRFSTVLLARLLGIEPSAEEIAAERQRFCNRLELNDEQSVAQWRADNHVSDEELDGLMRETVLCRRVHRWLLYSRWTERCARPLLDHMRWEGRYPEAAEQTAAQERLLQAADGDHMTIDAWGARLPELIAEHKEWSDLVIDTDVKTWAEDAGFHRNLDLKLELLRARSARQVLVKMLESSLEDDVADAPPPS
ncbi:MAG: hypothetical protein H6712_14180 [Myxococcales bacterium]|nr:hypothetical protein [Myxococcales bacterium]MCB9715010.1 hypothetical protein [Myxococcales bacterium]